MMKPMSKNGSATGTAPKKACRRPRWLGPLLDDPVYRLEDELDALIEELRRERDRKPRAVCERPDVNADGAR